MPKRGKVDGSFSPSWSTGPYIHLVSITYFSGLCVVLVRQRIKGIIHHHPCLHNARARGLFVLLGVGPLQLFTPGPMELDVTLVTVSCFTLQGRGETPQVQMRMQGRGACDSCVCVSQNSFR